MKPELQKLFEGVNGLAPEFLNKVAELVESKVEAARKAAILETEEASNTERLALVEAHRNEIQNLKESYKNEMATTLGNFLDSVVMEWANKNAPGIDALIKTEAAENMLNGMINVMKESRVMVVGDADGQIANLQERLAAAEKAKSEALTEAAELRKSTESITREKIISRVCEGMVDTKKEQVADLLEGIPLTTESEFEARAAKFRRVVEGKGTKKEDDDKDDDFTDKVGGKDGDDDNKDGDDKDIKEGKKPKKEGDDADDDEDDKDETDKEMNESIRAQLAAYKSRFGLNG
ncbi:hypothetical protein DEEACLCL_00020 [Salmonella phage CRW-SP2]|nr:hypothetical protein DEEACLCL_00020 [Salmonella phage CRW-SP2]